MVKNWKAPLLDERHSKHSNIGLHVTMKINHEKSENFTRDPPDGPEVILGHEGLQGFFGNNFW